ncbi:hypothetical protein QSJ18_03345 [Gordonia sp. ABSL1-1]|uniref:hypothetical protein n=1 Tax=Gordonia sp. ABSL1-1 TaxID=3053923 RepID=UPI0025744413|nr:hypothetical protein [Gordonia sp. ABSL1-1]MDL9935772.1 hypothetical protein [Gordonia sp. ABSL1-1]
MRTNWMNTTTPARVAVAVTSLAVTSLAGTAIVAATPAPAATPAALSISGDMLIAPGVHLLNIEAKGLRTSSGMTTGTYVATVKNGSMALPIQVKGPVTCIYTDATTGSLIYPITGSTPDILPAGARGAYAVQVTVRTGNPDKVGLMGPMPTSSFHGCHPGATPYTFEGTIETK